ncbi:MAG: hypothetical protein K940chlam3_00194 [Chlamydiae bacterium]|nr:hypothetical protein [Chlamydiota bacterium]
MIKNSHLSRRLSLVSWRPPKVDNFFPDLFDSQISRVSIHINTVSQERRVKYWVKQINRLDSTKLDSKAFLAFKKTFWEPSDDELTLLEMAFPKLDAKGREFVFTQIPEYSHLLIKTLTEQDTTRFFSSISIQSAFAIAFNIMELLNDEVPSFIVQAMESKMRKESAQNILTILEDYLTFDSLKPFFNALHFDLKFFITGNSNESHAPYFRSFWKEYKLFMAQRFEEGVKILLTSFKQVDQSFFFASVSLLDDQQLLFLLPLLTKEMFEIVEKPYMRLFTKYAEGSNTSELILTLKLAAGPHLTPIINQIIQNSESEKLSELLMEDVHNHLKYVKAIREKSGTNHKRKIISHIMENGRFFSIQRLFEKLLKMAKLEPSSRETRRIFLFTGLFVQMHPQYVFRLESIIRKMLQVEIESERSKEFLDFLNSELHVAKEKQFAHDMLELLKREPEKVSENISKIVYSYSHFTTTKILLQKIQDQIESSELRDSLLSLLTFWLKYRATNKEFDLHKNLLENVMKKLSDCDSKAYKKFSYAYQVKMSISNLSVEEENSSSSPRIKIEFEEVLDKAENHDNYQDDLRLIATDLRNYAIEIFSSISFDDFMSLNWLNHPGCDSTVNNVITEFNRLSKFTAVKILNPELASHGRAGLIDFFISLCQVCYEGGDFHSTYALYSAFDSSQIQQLKKTWRHVSVRHKKIKAKLDVDLDMSHNYQKIRQHMKWMTEYGRQICPCITIISQDLFSLNENMRNSDLHHINYSKLDALGKIFKDFHRWQMICQSDHRSRLRSDVKSSMKKESLSKDLWKLSQECEPRFRSSTKW